MKMHLQIRKISCKETVGWLLIGIALVMIGNSIRLCFSSDIWYDELFTMGMIEHSYGELIRFTARDVHPPFYYCITKIVVDLCKLIIPSADAVIAAKIVSVIPYFLLLVYVLAFFRKRFGIFAAGVFFFCILSMPQMSAYMVEVRMYSFALFFVTAAFCHAYGIACDHAHQKWHYAALTLYGLAAAYTQYFACVAIIMVYGYLFLLLARRHELKRWFFCVLISIVGYLPWLFVLFAQITAVRENYWILPLTWRSLGGCVKFLMKPAFSKEGVNTVLAVVLFFIYVALLAGYGYQVLIKKEKRTQNDVSKFYFALAGCIVLVGLVAFGFAASFVIRPIFVYRYMLPAMGCFWLCFALCLDALAGCERMAGKGNASYKNILTAITTFLIVTVGIRDYRAFLGEEEYKIVLMEETEQAISDIASEDIILYNFDQLQMVAGYYMEQESYLWNGTPETLIMEIFEEKGTVEDSRRIKQWLEEGRSVWFFGSFNSREEIRAEWEADGLSTEEMGSYMLERYWFNIYSVFDR